MQYVPRRDGAVSVHGLSKSYTIAHNAPKHASLAEALWHTFKKPAFISTSETFWTLRERSKKGDQALSEVAVVEEETMMPSLIISLQVPMASKYKVQIS